MILRKIDNPVVRTQFDHILDDAVDLFLLSRGKFRMAVLHGTRLVNQMRANHELGILETLILGHAYMASALMATSLKGGDHIGIHLQCDGPVGGIHAESTARGQVRGYLNVSSIPIDRPLESFDTAPFIGNGTITVSRHLENARHPFTGQISIEHGNLAQDLTRYYAISEQTPSALALSVHFDGDGNVTGAGGVLIQALPTSSFIFDDDDASQAEQNRGRYDAALADMEEIVEHLPSVGALFAEGKSSTEIVREHFDRFDWELVGTRPLEFACNCNRERFQRFLAAMSEDELADIKENGPFPLHITCHNCNSVYAFEREEILAIEHAAG